MEASTKTIVTIDQVEVAEARIGVYRFLLAALARPTLEQFDWMAGPEFRRMLDELCLTFVVASAGAEDPPVDFSDHESRYLACFEVGLPTPPVVLAASHYNRREPAPRVLHEHILLYRRFGARIPEHCLNSADHVEHQLAFLIRLDELLLQETAGTSSILRARNDFLTRHVSSWVSKAAAAAAAGNLPTLYGSLLALLVAAVNQDQELTAAALAEETP